MFENEPVIHSSFGNGTVFSYDGEYIKVEFGADVGIKTLSAETVIKNDFLTFANKEIQSIMVTEFITKPKEIERQIEEEKANAIKRAKEEKKTAEKLRKQAEEDRKYKAKSELLTVLKSYGFEGFLHTTELDNFKKIIVSGKLIPRNELIDKAIDFNDSANQEVLSHTDEMIKEFCRFYYYFKTPTNYRANYKHPVIMVFNEQIIYSENIFFSPYNAAKYYNRLTPDARAALEFPWDGIFERGEHGKSKYWKQEEGEKSAWNITGMRNAEFLVMDHVSTKNIKRIYFKYAEDMEKARGFCPEELQRLFCLDRSKFN